MEGLNYSFSGIKTSFLYFLQAQVKENPNFIAENLVDICASMQQTLIQILLAKLKRAAKLHNITEIAIAGGVSANSGLRKTLIETAQKHRWNVYIPAFQYCTDNAAMIAITAHFKYIAGSFEPMTTSASARSSWA